MNKIHMLSVLSLGLCFSARMYADGEQISFASAQEEVASKNDQSAIMKTQEELKADIEKEKARKIELEQESRKFFNGYEEKIKKMKSEVAASQKKALETTIKNNVEREINRIAKELAKKPMFQEKMDLINLEVFSEMPLAQRILSKARTYVEENDARMDKKLQSLNFKP